MWKKWTNPITIYERKIFHHGKYSQDVSLNIEYFILFKNVQDKTQIRTLASQMFPNNTKFLLNYFEDATNQPYSYLFLDLKSDTPGKIRIRCNILNNYNKIIVYLPK